MLRIHHNKVRIILKLFIDETNTFSNRGFFWRHSGSLFSLVSTCKYVQTLICTFEGAQQFSFFEENQSLYWNFAQGTTVKKHRATQK